MNWPGAPRLMALSHTSGGEGFLTYAPNAEVAL